MAGAGAREGATDEKLISRRSDSELPPLLLFSVDVEDVVDGGGVGFDWCECVLRRDPPVDGGGPTSYTVKKK